MRLTSKVRIQFHCEKSAVLQKAWDRWVRDLAMVTEPDQKVKSVLAAEAAQMEDGQFEVTLSPELEPETYVIHAGKKAVEILAGDELGVIYAFLFLSEKYLGISPFWFWNNQVFDKREFIDIPEGTYRSKPYKLRYRGWFINDEVLLDAWGTDRWNEELGFMENPAFEMAMEALLRLGGNMVIPGTDRNSHKYRKLASHMGLWITHHHAEPLGAKMFAREYPDKTPSYRQYPELFQALWRKGIEEQRNSKVVWNIGFRGQGDRPFWADDPQYDTPKKRGDLISQLIQQQYDLLCEYVAQPVCCTNLYGEVMELYQQGFIQLPENVIYIWADNGYGKMVSRRQGNHNPRIQALPTEKNGHHGIYYHASFYDLQAAAHITMLPNSDNFVRKELEGAMEKGVRDFLIVNCSNVKPHVYLLDAIARIWGKEDIPYVERYFPGSSKQMQKLYNQYFKSMLSYGKQEDEHAGEQYYHYTMRAVCHGWLTGKLTEPEADLKWLTGSVSLTEQVRWLQKKAREALPALAAYLESCKGCEKELRDAGWEQEALLLEESLLLQARIHYISLEAEDRMCDAFTEYSAGNYEKAFFMIGQSIELLQELLADMRAAEHEKWKGFYDNDCLTDIKFTAYMLEKVLGFIRNQAEGPHFYSWALKYDDQDKHNGVVLITNMRNHKKDWELYLLMKRHLLH